MPSPTLRRLIASRTWGRGASATATHFTIIWVGDLWERATFMRGMGNICMDVACTPAFVEELLEGLAQYIRRGDLTPTVFERFQFDGIAVSDDYGTQKSLVISPNDWRGSSSPVWPPFMGWPNSTAARCSITVADTSIRSWAT